MKIIRLLLAYLEKIRLKCRVAYWKAHLKECGKNVYIGKGVTIHFPEKICIGDNVRINANEVLDGRGGIEIGSGTVVSGGGAILTSDLKRDAQLSREHICEKIIIGENCWIGFGATILKGVQVTGKNVTIGAHALVTKSIYEDEVIVCGIPAKKIERTVKSNDGRKNDT